MFCVLQERSFGLNLPSIKDLACSQRGVIRGRGPCSLGRSFTSGPVCCIVRRWKAVCWKVFLLFHMIDLLPPPHPHRSFIHQPRMPNWSSPLLHSLDFLCYSLSVLSIYMSVFHVFHCLSTFVLLFLPHCSFIITWAVLFSSSSSTICAFIKLFFPFMFTLFLSSFSVALSSCLCLYIFSFVSDTGLLSFGPASRCAWGTFLI